MLNQPSNISPDEINGSGCVDLTNGVDISWQVSGDSAMLAYQIVFYQVNANSTQLASTGKVTLQTPFWGVDYKGNTQFFTVTLPASFFSSAGMSNGNEYKFVITQWYGSGAADYVQQSTASLFLTRTTPTLTIDQIDDPVTTRSYSLTATYDQAEGDAIRYVSWQIATEDALDSPFLDTGKIWGTGELRVDYDGFFTGTSYAVRCTVETVNGITVSTGWVTFSVSYYVGEPVGSVSACQLVGVSAVFVSWDQMEVAEGYSVYRRNTAESVLRKIADVDATTGQLRDYSAQSGQSYVYYIFPIGTLAYLTEPMVSAEVSVQYWVWSILEAEPVSGQDGVYQMVAAHVFAMGEGGVNEGTFQNNNSPNFLKNFTRYPTRQPETSNYLSGNVSGYIGTIDWTAGGYSDSVKDSNKIFQLSTTDNELFLQDPKGHFLHIHTAENITLQVSTKKAPLPQTMTIPWAEIGSTDGVSIIAAPGGQYYPTDTVITTQLRIDPMTGSLIWTRANNYQYGSVLLLDQASGALIQRADGSFTVATMEMDQETGIVTASTGSEG